MSDCPDGPGRPRRLKRTCPDDRPPTWGLGRVVNQAEGDRFPEREATPSQVY